MRLTTIKIKELVTSYFPKLEAKEIDIFLSL
jgi:hypothetical protein